MRLEGQYHEIAVDLPSGSLDAASVPPSAPHLTPPTSSSTGPHPRRLPIEVLHWRLSAIGPEQQVGAATLPMGDMTADIALKGSRPVWFDNRYRDTPIYDRDLLQPGMRIVGPAVLEEREATIRIGPGDDARVDEHLAIITRIAP
ncbi:MAG: hypothetical protein M9890_06025 [Thermomicrobiales bacterium]|nr:hypothetical protein [Thermomicrobiales bacterium]